MRRHWRKGRVGSTVSSAWLSFRPFCGVGGGCLVFGDRGPPPGGRGRQGRAEGARQKEASAGAWWSSRRESAIERAEKSPPAAQLFRATGLTAPEKAPLFRRRWWISQPLCFRVCGAAIAKGASGPGRAGKRGKSRRIKGRRGMNYEGANRAAFRRTIEKTSSLQRRLQKGPKKSGGVYRADQSQVAKNRPRRGTAPRKVRRGPRGQQFGGDTGGQVGISIRNSKRSFARPDFGSREGHFGFRVPPLPGGHEKKCRRRSSFQVDAPRNIFRGFLRSAGFSLASPQSEFSLLCPRAGPYFYPVPRPFLPFGEFGGVVARLPVFPPQGDRGASMIPGLGQIVFG